MTLKRVLRNKDFTRQKRGSGASGQKEQHELRPGKAQGKPREREPGGDACSGDAVGKGNPAKSWRPAKAAGAGPTVHRVCITGKGRSRILAKELLLHAGCILCLPQ